VDLRLHTSPLTWRRLRHPLALYAPGPDAHADSDAIPGFTVGAYAHPGSDVRGTPAHPHSGKLVACADSDRPACFLRRSASARNCTNTNARTHLRSDSDTGAHLVGSRSHTGPHQPAT
jgi:hypothetical protein